MTPPTITETLVAHFYVKGEPAPQPRPRGRLVTPRNGKAFVTIYNPSDADDWKHAVCTALARSGQRRKLEGPLGLEIDFFLPRPQYLHESKYPRGPIQHESRPDSDNLAKSTMDALGDAGLFGNDGQICSLTVRKWYAAVGMDPGAIIAVYERTAGDEQLGLMLDVAEGRGPAVPESGLSSTKHAPGTPPMLAATVPPPSPLRPAKCPMCGVRPVDPDGDGMCAACFSAMIEGEALAEEER